MDTSLQVAVIMERRTLANKWADCQWEAVGILPDASAETETVRKIVDTPERAQWLHGSLQIRLFTDEAENYLLNVTAPEPRVFIHWRMEDGLARPVAATVSYGEAARTMDAGESVDGVPMPAEMREWVEAFARHWYRPEDRPRKGGRFASVRGEHKGGR